MSGEVKSVSHSSVEQDGYLLTNVVWHNGYGAANETGIREYQSDGKYGNFRLIQHSWFNFAEANAFILSALKKGWDDYKISTVMEFLNNRKRR